MQPPDEEPPVLAETFCLPPSSVPSIIPSLFDQVLDDMQVLQQRLREAHLVELAQGQAAAVHAATSSASPEPTRQPPASASPRSSSKSGGRSSLRMSNTDTSLAVPDTPKAKNKTTKEADSPKKTKSVSINLEQDVEAPVPSPTVSVSFQAPDDCSRGSGIPGLDGSEVPASRRSSGLSDESTSPRSARTTSRLMKQARELTVNMEAQVADDSLDGALQLREEWDMEEDKLKSLKRIQRRMSVGSMASMKSTARRQYLLATDKQSCPWYIMHPNKPRRITWDMLAIFVILFEICFSPLHLYNMEATFRQTAELVQWVATCYWIVDIPMSFLTAVYINDTLHCQLSEIAKSYLWTWFPFDVVMLIPDLLVVVLSNRADQPTGVLRFVRFRRMFRLLRFFQIIRLWRIVEGFNIVEGRLTFLRTEFGSVIRPVLNVLILMAVSVHVLGSLWFASGFVDGGWVMEEGLHEESLGRQYTRSIEWALSRLPPSALRFNVELRTPAERWLGISGTCAALICSSIFVSFVTNTMANVARERMRTNQILQSVRKYCSTHCISYSYTMQMRRYVEREARRNELCSHMPLLQNLPEGMVRELFQEARAHTLHSHAFFKEIGSSDPSMELNLCSQAVTELYLLAGDVIFDMTRKTEGMYIMASGVSIYFYWSSDPGPAMNARRSTRRNTTGSLFKGMLSAGPPPPRTRSKVTMAQTMVEADEYVAEPALWVKAWRHQGQLQSMVECRALLVHTEDLFKVFQGYANTLANAVVYARCFVQELNKTAPLSREVNDLPLGAADAEEPEARGSGGRSKSRSMSMASMFGPSKVQPGSS